jgi:hypothetical protein
MEFLSLLASPWGFGSIFSICLLIVFIVLRSGFLKLSKHGIEVGKISRKKVSPHASCPYSRDIMEIIHRTLDYSEKRMQLKTELIENQMRFYEEYEEEVQNELKKIFLETLANKLKDIDSYIQHPEYNSYVITIKAISYDIKGYIRSCFRSNHYATLSIEEQLSYTEKKINIIVQKTTELLNLYWRGTYVSRLDIKKANMNKIHIFTDLLKEVFNRAFLLARENSKQLDEMEKSYKVYLDSIVGEQ